MLNKLHTYLGYHVQAGVSSLRFLLRNPLATLMTIVVIAITLTLPAVFWVFADNVQHMSNDWQRGGHISLYLETPLPPDAATALLEQVRTTPGVGEATFKSPAEGLVELQQQDGMQDIMQYLPDNPLPAVIDISPAANINSAEELNKLYQIVKSYSHVEQAKFDMQWINRLYTLLDVVAKVADGLMLLLATAVILIIGNTLRMAIHNRHEEIQVLQFIGAGNAYIIRPFLYLGIFYALAGAILAMLLVNAITFSLGLLVNQVAETYQMHYDLIGLSFRQTMLLVVSAITLGWVGARLSVSSLCRAQVG